MNIFHGIRIVLMRIQINMCMRIVKHGQSVYFTVWKLILSMQASWSEVSRKLYINHAQFSYRKQLSLALVLLTPTTPPHLHAHNFVHSNQNAMWKIPKWAKGNRKKAVRKFIYYSHERYFFLSSSFFFWSMTKKRRVKRAFNFLWFVFFQNFLFQPFLGIFDQLAMLLVEY